MKSVAILQSCYIPWKGYFDIIQKVDEFILYDDIPYSKNNWRNRNRIKTPNGCQWLTIPVSHHLDTLICEVKISDDRWAKKHWKSIQVNYASALFFKTYKVFFEDIYNKAGRLKNLSEVNYLFIHSVCELFNIKTKLSYSTDYPHTGNKTEKLIQICKGSGADNYFTGPAAKSYIDLAMFQSVNINVNYFSYDHYQPYPQLYGEFIHEVSILDLIFNAGIKKL